MKARALISGFSTIIALSTTVGVVYAANTNPSANETSTSQNMAWVLQDVTRQDNYTLTYETLNPSGQVVSKREVVPPLGSLVVSKRVPLSEAQAESLPYIPASGITPTARQFAQLHQKLFNLLNPTTSSPTASQTVMSPLSTGNQIVFGQFNTNDTTLGYDVYYTDLSNGYLSVTNFYTWQSAGSGHAWEEIIGMTPPGSSVWSWNYVFNNKPEITTQSTDVSWSGSGGGLQGSTFETEVESDNIYGENYYGYTTLN